MLAGSLACESKPSRIDEERNTHLRQKLSQSMIMEAR
jgi:hypothetical protein